MSSNELVKDTEASFEAEDIAEPIPPSDIVAYNELRSCADLLRLHSTGKLEIQPDFQREVVWKAADKTRFIDSLVKQLPIPSMCFSLDYKTQKWKVIDGLQSMSSIILFLSEQPWQLTNLQDIHPRLRGASNVGLRAGDDEQRRLYALVQDVSIPVTVIRCDYSQETHMRYLFTIFHRLNSGGVRLTNQEIRNCIFTGPFNDLLKAFDKTDKSWKLVTKRIWGSMDRFRSIEVLLRALAFNSNSHQYDGNLARFLNDYMQARGDDSAEVLEKTKRELEWMTQLAARTLQLEEKKKLPLSLVEAILVGILQNIGKLTQATDKQLGIAYKKIAENEVFADAARYAVSSPENFAARLYVAGHAFAEN